jgi:hypothetical protein
MATSLTSMLIQRTKAVLYANGLAIATGLGIDTTSWQAGDPTRSLYHWMSDSLATLEELVSGFVKSGFLEYATGDWLTILAKQVYNVDRIEATFATAPCVLTNAGGGLFTPEAGDVVALNSTTGKTYTNTTGGTLSSSGTLTLDFSADEAGADSNAAVGEIDTLVTTMLGVTISNGLAAVGIDQESDESLRERCRAKLAALSPNGPRDAFEFVVRDSTLTGNSTITRARVIGESGTGDVTIYVAGAAGAVLTGAVSAAQTAAETWAAPLCVTPSVVNSSNVSVPVTYEVWMYTSVGEDDATVQAKIAADLLAMFATRPIGGDIIAPATTGKLYQSLIEATIKESYPDHTFRVVVTAPSGDTSLAIGEVATLGSVTPTVHKELDP